MLYSKGDYVSVLDEDLSGVIKAIVGNTITIETEDGFVLDFESSEIVKMESPKALQSNVFDHDSLQSVRLEKQDSHKRKQPPKKTKQGFEPTMEVDLHINQLVKSTKGMSNHDMLTLQLDTARHKLNFALKKRVQKLVFIHGVGEGVLKLELEYLFGKYDGLKFYDANYQKYGLGATEVYIYQNTVAN